MARSTIAFLVHRQRFLNLFLHIFVFQFSPLSLFDLFDILLTIFARTFSELNFLNCARDPISNWTELRGAMKGCSDTWSHGHPEKFSPDHQGPGFLSKPFFDAPLPRIFA